MTPPPVLYIEDDENDVLLMRQAWARVNVQNPLLVVSNGQEALDHLAENAPYADRADHRMPCLVLLDLKLPKVSGLEVLRFIRSQPTLIGLRVVVLSSSNTPADINAAHGLRIDAYLVKSSRFDEMLAAVDTLNVYWLRGR